MLCILSILQYHLTPLDAHSMFSFEYIHIYDIEIRNRISLYIHLIYVPPNKKQFNEIESYC